jgi:hypothetical protein
MRNMHAMLASSTCPRTDIFHKNYVLDMASVQTWIQQIEFPTPSGFPNPSLPDGHSRGRRASGEVPGPRGSSVPVEGVIL